MSGKFVLIMLLIGILNIALWSSLFRSEMVFAEHSVTVKWVESDSNMLEIREDEVVWPKWFNFSVCNEGSDGISRIKFVIPSPCFNFLDIIGREAAGNWTYTPEFSFPDTVIILEAEPYGLPIDSGQCGEVDVLLDYVCEPTCSGSHYTFYVYTIDNGASPETRTTPLVLVIKRACVHNLDTRLNYTSIQEAINEADPGDTIYVRAGVYHEDIVINKSLFLVGENAVTTVLDGEGESLLILSVMASDVTVRDFTVKNTRADQPAYGVSIKDSQNVSLMNVTVGESYTGLVLTDSSHCEIVNNAFMNSYAYGVDLRDNSVNNTVVGNWVVANPTGIRIWDPTCENNRFHHNNFVNNTNQIDVTYAGPTIWDDRNEGNYWSNYNGADLDSDGIGDTYIPWEAVDNYPLMGMFSDFNANSEYHIQTICNSTISNFNYNGTAIFFNVSGANGTAGFCRMCIPKALMNETYRVFVNGTEILPAPLPLPCSNSTHNYIYFNYTHSIQNVVIVPEFPSLIILPLFMIATLLAAILYRRRGYD